MMKKVLIITYYWIPAGGPGIQRWLKFVKYLRDFDIEPIVYAPENPNYPIEDYFLGDDLPSDIKIIHRSIIEPYAIARWFSSEKTKKISSGIISSKGRTFLEKLMLWVRGNIFIPDARFLWVQPSIRYLKKYISDNEIDTIITTGPPHSVHLIGLGLKKNNLSLKWIADFRDPWVNIGYHSDLYLTQRSKNKHQKLEQEVLQNADTIIVTSFTTQREFQSKTNKPVEIITNGYDFQPKTKKHRQNKFIISHIGSLLSERNPKKLWKVLGHLVIQNQEFANDFQLVLAGKVSDEVFADLKKYRLDSYLDFKGYVTHNQAIDLQCNSELLLLLEIDKPQTQGIIAGKLFEYMASGTPILAIGYKQWDVKNIIEQTQTGDVAESQNEAKIAQVISYRYEQYKNNENVILSNSVSLYHRKYLTSKLAELIIKN